MLPWSPCARLRRVVTGRRVDAGRQLTRRPGAPILGSPAGAADPAGVGDGPARPPAFLRPGPAWRVRRNRLGRRGLSWLYGSAAPSAPPSRCRAARLPRPGTGHEARCAPEARPARPGCGVRRPAGHRRHAARRPGRRLREGGGAAGPGPGPAAAGGRARRGLSAHHAAGCRGAARRPTRAYKLTRNASRSSRGSAGWTCLSATGPGSPATRDS